MGTRKVSVKKVGNQLPTLHRFLDTNGDGTGTKNAIGNYTNEIFYFQPSAKKAARITRLIVSIEDSGCQWERYGGIAGGLTNGIEVKVADDDGAITDLTDGVVVKSNAHWGANCFDAELKSVGAGNDFFQVRWTFSKAGQFVRLTEDQRLEVYLNDDFSDLVGHYFKIEGYWED